MRRSASFETWVNAETNGPEISGKLRNESEPFRAPSVKEFGVCAADFVSACMQIVSCVASCLARLFEGQLGTLKGLRKVSRGESPELISESTYPVPLPQPTALKLRFEATAVGLSDNWVSLML